MNLQYTSGLGLIVPRKLVKKVKDSLEAGGQLDKNTQIRPLMENEYTRYLNGENEIASKDKFYIPTTVPSVTGWDAKDWISLNAGLLNMFNLNGLRGHETEIGIATNSSQLPDLEPGAKPESAQTQFNRLAVGRTSQNLLARTIDTWLDSRPQELSKRSDSSRGEWQSSSDDDEDHRFSSLSYTVYPPLLLLPPTAIPTPPSIDTNELSTTHLPSLYDLLCKTFAVTHIALNAPIPASFSTSPITTANPTPSTPEQKQPNILRSPTGLLPLHGDFGPALPPTHPPTAADFASAFWCSARQNGIFQTWAPRYTMFSRGNVSEKARVLRLRSLTEERLGRGPEETSAVDLFAGIGYFAFSYARARVGKVLCWEINPWSVEGLRRGAEGNRWGVGVVAGGDVDGDATLRRSTEGRRLERLLVFREGNAYAAERIAMLRDLIPPVRHVNCGFLPSSKDSWEVAVRVLDPAQGGWIHAHENVAKKDIETRGLDIVQIFADLVTTLYGPEPEQHRRVSCEHVERVKSYSPGVIHCVFDIAITPSNQEP